MLPLLCAFALAALPALAPPLLRPAAPPAGAAPDPLLAQSEGGTLPLLVSEFVDVREDPAVAAALRGSLRQLLEERPGGPSGRQHGFRRRVLRWLGQISETSSGRLLLERLGSELQRRGEQVLIRPIPTVLSAEAVQFYTSESIEQYATARTETVGSGRLAGLLRHGSYDEEEIARTPAALGHPPPYFAVEPDLEYRRGSGLGSVISLEPGLDPEPDSTTDGLMASCSAGPGRHRPCALPSFVVLGHELVHALHFARGEAAILYRSGALLSNYEEERTILGDRPGSLLPLFEPGRGVSENSLRAESGLPLRATHALTFNYQSRFDRAQAELRRRLGSRAAPRGRSGDVTGP